MLKNKTSIRDWYSPLQTPHSGYHWDSYSPNFFEGWYFRVSLPAVQQSFAFMYSLEDPLRGSASNSAVHFGMAVTFGQVRAIWVLGIGENTTLLPLRSC
jgi:Tocopherol cyclase